MLGTGHIPVKEEARYPGIHSNCKHYQIAGPALAASPLIQTCIFQSKKLRHRQLKVPTKGGDPPNHAATLLQTSYFLPPQLLWPSGGHHAAMRTGQPVSLTELEISTSLRQKRTASFRVSHPPVIGTARSHLPYFLIKKRGH